jgi:hypothetical protein
MGATPTGVIRAVADQGDFTSGTAYSYGIYGRASTDADNSPLPSSGTAYNYAGYFIADGDDTGSANPAVNNYAVYASAVLNSGLEAYAFYSPQGYNYFAGNTAIAGNISTTVRLGVKGTGNTGVSSAIKAINSSDVLVFDAKNNGELDVQGQVVGQFGYLGSAGVPAFSFNTDIDTGMYSPAADTISFTTGGTEAVRINSSEQILGQYAYLGSAGVPAYSFNTDTNTGMYSSAADTINFTAGGVEQVEISSAGLAVGSGTQTWQLDATTSTLNFQSGATPTTRASMTSAGQLAVQVGYLGSVGNPGYSFGTDTNTGIYSPLADTISITTGGIEAVRINSSEQILGQYAYLGSAGVPAFSFNTDTNTGMYSVAADTIAFTTGGTEAMRINSAQELTIGYGATDNGAYKLQVNSQIFATSATIATSDARYKENVSDLQDGIGVVRALRPVEFDWKQHPVHNFDLDSRHVGFLAQEVITSLSGKSYVDSVVKLNTMSRTGEDGEKTVVEQFYGLSETALIPILTRAIQQQQEQIDRLNALLISKGIATEEDL